jgi:hypothetical protein
MTCGQRVEVLLSWVSRLERSRLLTIKNVDRGSLVHRINLGNIIFDNCSIILKLTPEVICLEASTIRLDLVNVNISHEIFFGNFNTQFIFVIIINS